LSDKDEHIHDPNAKKLPTSKFDVNELLFRCFKEGLAPEQAVKECKSHGASYVELREVELHYMELERLKQKWIDAAKG